ncbi:MAG: hypothetical protein KGH60_02995 [Candidatus Micrarchaeota archaeon]|nr:hypothetical protein [Candidatus Micrarchaeota archaeon]
MTGMVTSVSRLKISALERAKTIERTEDGIKKREAAIRKGLGIDYSSVAGIGETSVTEAALAVAKLLLLYGIKPSEIKTFKVATETPTGTSENISVQVRKATNKILSTLTKNGINGLDEFKPVIKDHMQSACASAGSAIAGFAMNGLEGGKAIVVATDKAEYKFGSNADSTGGAGAVAYLFEKSTDKTKGVRYARIIGSADDDIPDFLKPIFDDIYKESGISRVTRHAIVFGDYSNGAYTDLRYLSLRNFSEKSGVNFDNLEITELVKILPHLPYPNMDAKELAYYTRHLARENEELRTQLMHEINNMPHPALGGYEDIGTALRFMTRMGALYYGIVGVPNEIKKRLEEAEGKSKNSELIEQKLNANKEYIIDGALEELQDIVKDLLPTRNLSDALVLVGENLVSLKNQSAALTLSSMEEAFKPLYDDTKGQDGNKLGVITRFEDDDKAYNSAIRNTTLYKTVLENLSTDTVIKLSKIFGNMYTASQGVGKEGFLVFSDNPEESFQADSFYGSGAESLTMLSQARNSEQLIQKMLFNVITEQDQQRETYAPEYTSIRQNKLLIRNDEAPLTHDTLFRQIKINEAQLMKHLAPYVQEYIKLKQHGIAEAEPIKAKSVSK